MQHGQSVALVWDERMEMHEEGKVCPHPERPDRVRAIMSCILASNLAGALFVYVYLCLCVCVFLCVQVVFVCIICGSVCF